MERIHVRRMLRQVTDGRGWPTVGNIARVGPDGRPERVFLQEELFGPEEYRQVVAYHYGMARHGVQLPLFDELGGKRLPQGVWGIGRRDVRFGKIPGHQALDGADTQRAAGLEGTRKNVLQVRRLEPTPLAQRMLDIRRIIDHPIDVVFPVVDADGPGLTING
jgi:hypothetical protein